MKEFCKAKNTYVVVDALFLVYQDNANRLFWAERLCYERLNNRTGQRGSVPIMASILFPLNSPYLVNNS